MVKNKNPSVEQISNGWGKYIKSIESIHKKYNRPVLFTEIGYKSTADSAIEPWEWIDYEEVLEENISNETQSNCYQAFFDTVWDQKWFAGVHIWQWRCDHRGNSKYAKSDFTPRDKPATEVIAKGFE